jgi:hypothetical protein
MLKSNFTDVLMNSLLSRTLSQCIEYMDGLHHEYCMSTFSQIWIIAWPRFFLHKYLCVCKSRTYLGNERNGSEISHICWYVFKFSILTQRSVGERKYKH